MPASKEKNYGIELFRIVAMLMIIIHHILYHGGIQVAANKEDAWIKLATTILYATTICAVNCYAIISGFLGVNKRQKYGSIVSLWVRVMIYSVAIAGITKIVAPQLVDTKEMVGAFLPVSMNEYWYFTAYVGLFLIAPALNLFMEKTTKNQAKILLICLFLLSFVSTGLLKTDPLCLNGGHSVFWLMIVYLLGAYIGKYGIIKNHTKSKAIGGFIVCIAVSIVLKYILSKIQLGLNPSVLIGHISPTMVLASVFLLQFFTMLNIKNKKVKKMIITLSAASFSVYLLHDNPIVRNTAIINRFTGLASMPAPIMIIAIIGTAILIYTICFVIDYFRGRILNEKKIKDIVDAKTEHLTS